MDYNHLLSELNIHPVLIDVGASGAPPEIWGPIAPSSIYVGFDPDLREIHEIPDGCFYRATIVNKAIISDEEQEVPFYFTKSPFCSSTLNPDLKALSNFLFSDLFEVEREAKVRATTLNSIVDGLSLPCIDWLKTDSQGTDLRIFNSLRPEIRSRVLAIDIEPGLIDAYVGEDLFVDAHRDLTQNGFWLSNLEIGGAIRIRRSTLREIKRFSKEIDETLVKRVVKRTPAWCGARYFRTIEWLIQGNFAKREYILLWIFALLDRQFGFALDLAIEYKRAFGIDNIFQLMMEKSILSMRRFSLRKRLFAIAKSFVPIRIRRMLKKLTTP